MNARRACSGCLSNERAKLTTHNGRFLTLFDTKPKVFSRSPVLRGCEVSVSVSAEVSVDEEVISAGEFFSTSPVQAEETSPVPLAGPGHALLYPVGVTPCPRTGCVCLWCDDYVVCGVSRRSEWFRRMGEQ